MKLSSSPFVRHETNLTIEKVERPAIQTLVTEYQGSLPFPGDNFIPDLLSGSDLFRIQTPDLLPAGFFAIQDRNSLTALYLRGAFRHLEREMFEEILTRFSIQRGFIRTFDHHSLPLFLEYQRKCEPQAYQFQLDPATVRPLPRPDIRLKLADRSDLPFLEQMSFLPNSAGYVRRQEAWIARDDSGQSVGIGIIQPHQSFDRYMDIGMFTCPSVRRQGIGRTILLQLIQLVLQSGRIPVAGCYYQNHLSRRTLESAGMTCVGAIFRFYFKRPAESPDRR